MQRPRWPYAGRQPMARKKEAAFLMSDITPRGIRSRGTAAVGTWHHAQRRVKVPKVPRRMVVYGQVGETACLQMVRVFVRQGRSSKHVPSPYED